MAAAGTDHWYDPPQCIKDALAACCALTCSPLVPLDGTGAGHPVLCTIQNVSGCACVDGVVMTTDGGGAFGGDGQTYDDPSAGAYCVERDIAGTPTPGRQTVVWQFATLTPAGTCGVDCNLVFACCDYPDRSVCYLNFECGLHDAILVTGYSIDGVPLSYSVAGITIVSFTADPLELILEGDVQLDVSSDPSLCYPGRLRFVFTRM